MNSTNHSDTEEVDPSNIDLHDDYFAATVMMDLMREQLAIPKETSIVTDLMTKLPEVFKLAIEKDEYPTLDMIALMLLQNHWDEKNFENSSRQNTNISDENIASTAESFE